MKKSYYIILGVAIIIPIALLGLFSRTKFGSGLVAPDRISVAIGSSASPQTLTNSFSTSSVMRMNGTNNVAIGFDYLPKSYGSSLYIAVERSLDNGSTYVPYLTINPSTDRTYVYTSGATGTLGIPFSIGDGTSASGTSIKGSFDFDMTADYVRFAVKESTTSTAGTLYANMLLNN